MSKELYFLSKTECKEKIIEIGKRIYNKGYVASNDGNISIKVSENEIWVTPTGVSKGFMNDSMLVKMNLDGTVIEQNNYEPSSEVKMHLKVYKENPNVTSVVHAHPLNCTLCSILGIPLDLPVLVEAILQIGTIPIAHYAEPGTNEIPDSISPFCKNYNGVLLANHGALSWGDNIEQAFARMEVMEYYAKIILRLKNEPNYLSLSKNQINSLIKIREKTGIYSGHFPIGVDYSENENDIFPQEI